MNALVKHKQYQTCMLGGKMRRVAPARLAPSVKPLRKPMG